MIVIPIRPLLPDGFDQGLLLVEGDLIGSLFCSPSLPPPPLSKLISEFIVRGYQLESHSAFLADLVDFAFQFQCPTCRQTGLSGPTVCPGKTQPVGSHSVRRRQLQLPWIALQPLPCSWSRTCQLLRTCTASVGWSGNLAQIPAPPPVTELLSDPSVSVDVYARLF